MDYSFIASIARIALAVRYMGKKVNMIIVWGPYWQTPYENELPWTAYVGPNPVDSGTMNYNGENI